MTDRLPPHSTASERAVLGCQLLAPNQCVPEVIERLNSNVSAFYDLRHQEVQRTIFESFESQIPIDLVTIQAALKNRGMLEQIGGIVYLGGLQNEEPSSANLPVYLDDLIEKHMLRNMISIATEFVGRAFAPVFDTHEIIERFERDVMAVRIIKGGQQRPIREIVNEAINGIDLMFQRKGQISGLSTGLVDLDAETDGLHPAEMTLIAAYPSVGKTSLAMNIVENVVLELKLPVGVFSAEMSDVSLVTRTLCSTARVNLRHIRSGHMVDSDFPKLTNAAGKLGASKLFIDDSSDMTTSQLRAKARRMVQQHGVKLFVVDYAQLINSPGAENRTGEIDQVGKTCKRIAKELKVPVILLSQLNDDGKLKGARALGEDADNLIILKRPKEADDHENSNVEPIECWVMKQRNGPRNVCVNLNFS